ncbi:MULTISPECIES: FAD-dependent oxidoreductase [unclassified Roseitalea]|uniref:FAD-dependent oxidoreductase n=1 Tax=unclassified Roseitalea TaxID=2639107 RepID=UPI00273F94D7|nr:MULTISPECIES: FAD-dependent oxidoreductase [unclassified Roseitalea]
MPDHERTDHDLAIVGAGIAGLTCALALAARGREVTVIEAFDEPSEIGAGLQVPPNAAHILDKLGVLGALNARAVRPAALCLGDSVSGRIVLEMPVNGEANAPPYLTAHRAIVHGVLYSAARADVRVQPLQGHRIVKVAEHDDRVELTAARGEAHVTLSARCVIAADGIWSNLRSAVPGAARPEPTGRIALRAVVPAPAERADDKVVAWMAPRAHLVTYPVRNAATRNLVAVTSGTGRGEGWSHSVDLATLDALFARLGETPVAGLAERADWTLWPLYALAPDAAWHTARIGLIGDAAHGIEPFAAQGAAMAIEDGWLLAQAIERHDGNPQAAFAAFRQQRLPRIERVARRTAFNRFTYHQAGIGRLARNAAFRMRPPAAFRRDLDWLYGYRA